MSLQYSRRALWADPQPHFGLFAAIHKHLPPLSSPTTVVTRIPWYSLYPSSADTGWLTGVVLQHAAFVASAAVAARAI